MVHKSCRVTVYVDGVIYRFAFLGRTADAVLRYLDLFPRAQRISVVAK